jgi:hypothetical protein
MPIGIAIGLTVGLILSWSGIFSSSTSKVEQPEISYSYKQEPQRKLIQSSTIATADEETEASKSLETEPQDTIRTADGEAKETIETASITKVIQTSDNPIRIQVLNGCGAKGITKQVAPGLRSLGFDVRESGNAKNYKHKTSKVYSRNGNMALANKVADAVGIDRSFVSELIDPELADIDVTIVIGADYSTLNFGLNGKEGEEQAER